MPTVIRGMRGTENIESTIKIVDWSDITYLEDPKNKSSFIKFLSQLPKAQCKREKFTWHTDELVPWRDQVNGTSALGDTTVTVDNGGYWAPNDVGKNEDSGEQFLVTAVNGNVLTIVRAQGETAAAELTNNDWLLNLGSAFAQGSVLNDQPTTKEVENYNYTRIMRHSFKLTETEMAIGKAGKLIGGDDRARQREKKAIEHMQAWNLTAYFGERYLDSANQRTFTRGLYLATASGNRSTQATLSEANFNSETEAMVRYGESEEKLLITGRRISAFINTWAKGNSSVASMRRLNDKTGDVDFGIRIKRYEGDHADFRIIRDNALNDSTTYVKYAFVVDPSDIGFVHLPGRDTRLLVGLQANDMDGIMDEYRTEAGFRWGHPSHHGVFNAVTAAA